MTHMLHEKHPFIQYARECGLPVPDTHTITTRTDAEHVLQKAPPERRYIMKTIGMFDAARGDLTLLPKASHDQTLKHLQNLAISETCPWILQQFIKGSEFCTHSVVVNGQVRAFVACPSAELLMHYQMLPPDYALSLAMTEKMAATAGKGFTGHLSFDFMVEEHDLKSAKPVLYPIECNPRAHTTVILFTDTHGMIDAYMSLLDGNGPAEVITPAHTGGYKFYWIDHDLVTKFLVPLIKLCAMRVILYEAMYEVVTFLNHVLFGRDGTFELWNPLPWWWLYHVYWPMRFWHYLRTGTRWSRINVSTTKVFED